MACYGVPTDAIEQLAIGIREFPAKEAVNWEQERMEAYEREHREQLLKLEALFVEAVFAFLRILQNILVMRIRLAREQQKESVTGFHETFLPIYGEAMARSRELLEEILAEAFAKEPALRVELLSEVSASLVPAEMAQFSRSVDTAGSTAQAEAHADAAKEITDSVKEVIKEFAKRIPLVKKLKKRNLELGLHAINEVVGIVK